MFRWYGKAQVCYAYLSDVEQHADKEPLTDKIKRSRWFTRGWTLQELVAPKEVVFYSSEWWKIDSKSGMHALLSEITGIESNVLKYGKFENVSVARRMSWAANRHATRVEDMAYSLLGIFDCNMPLLYGEGEKAFIRLQEEIMRVSDDQSLFAWGLPDHPLYMEDFSVLHGFLEAYTMPSYGKQRVLREERLQDLDLEKGLVGLLATSPAEFANSGTINKTRHLGSDMPPMATNRGIRIELPFFPHAFAFKRPGAAEDARCETCFDEAWLSFAVIACCNEGDLDSTIGIPLLAWSRDSFARLRGGAALIPASRWRGASLERARAMSRTLVVRRPAPDRARVASRFTLAAPPAGWALGGLACASHASYDERRRALRVAPERAADEGAVHAALFFARRAAPTFAVVLGGRPGAGLPAGPWAACVLVSREAAPAPAAGDGEAGVVQASWAALSALVQSDPVVDDDGETDPMLASIWDKRSQRSRTCISSAGRHAKESGDRGNCVVEVDMAMAPLNLVESGVFVEVNVSSNLGQSFDEKRTRPKWFLG